MSNLKLPVKEVCALPAIKGFLKNSFLDWRGKIVSVIFLGGCNFRCPYCHNKELVLYPDDLPTIPFPSIQEYLSVYGDWLDGIVISGGEPCLDSGLPDFCKILKQIGMKIKVDTNGSMPNVLDLLIREGLVDYVAMDFKSPLNEMSYRRCSGVWSDIARIGESIDLLMRGNVEYEFRVTICSGLLNKNDLKSMAERIQGAKRFVLQNFTPRNTLEPSCAAKDPMPSEILKEMQQEISPYVQESLILSSY